MARFYTQMRGITDIDGFLANMPKDELVDFWIKKNNSNVPDSIKQYRGLIRKRYYSHDSRQKSLLALLAKSDKKVKGKH